MNKKTLLLLFFCILLSFFLNVYNLENYPPSVHCDELFTANAGKQIATGETQSLISTSWWGVPAPAFILHAASYFLFGDTITAARVPSAILGTLTLLPLSIMALLMFNRTVAFISLILLFTSHWWLAITRVGSLNVMSIFTEVVVFLLLYLGFLKKKKSIFFAIGILIGLGNYQYLVFKIVPVLVIFLFFHQLIRVREDRKRLITFFAITVVTAGIVYMPMIVYYAKNPSTILGRVGSSYIFSDDPNTIQHMEAANKTKNRMAWLINNIKRSSDLSENSGDTSTQYGYRGRLLDLLTLTLFLLGQLIALKNLKKVQYFLLLIWFWLTYFAFTMLTVDPVTYHRIVGLFPAVYIFVGISLYSIIQTIKRRIPNIPILESIPYLFLTIIMCTIVFINLKIYFFDNPRNNIQLFQKRPGMYVSEYLKTLSHDYRVILLSEPVIYPEDCVFWYFTPSLPITSLVDSAPLPEMNGPKVFVVSNQYKNRLEEIQRKYPGGTTRRIEDNSGYIYTTPYNK